MSGYRKPYTYVEDKKILHHIIQKNAFHRLRGFEFWKEVRKEILPNRTHQSLHERFRKYIINNIQNANYGLSFDEREKIKTIYEQSARTVSAKEKNGGPKITTYLISKGQEGPSSVARDFVDYPDSDNSFERTSTETSRTKTIGSAIANVSLRKEIQRNANEENGVIPSTSTSTSTRRTSTRLQNVSLRKEIQRNANEENGVIPSTSTSTSTRRTSTRLQNVSLRKEIQRNANEENGVIPSTSTSTSTSTSNSTRLQNVECEDDSSGSSTDSEVFSLVGFNWRDT